MNKTKWELMGNNEFAKLLENDGFGTDTRNTDNKIWFFSSGDYNVGTSVKDAENFIKLFNNKTKEEIYDLLLVKSGMEKDMTENIADAEELEDYFDFWKEFCEDIAWFCEKTFK